MIKTLKYEVDENYISTLGIKLLTGRNFSRDLTTDSNAVILNETVVRVLGWGNAAVGHSVLTSLKHAERTSYHVIGVVKDFNFRSLHERISPLVMTLSPNRSTLIAKSEEPFTYSFLDERFNATYRAEQKTGILLGLFAGLTIFVACLGLVGLALFTAHQRTKEIGIRKVLGASNEYAFKRVFKTGSGRLYPFLSLIVLGDAEMASGFCL